MILDGDFTPEEFDQARRAEEAFDPEAQVFRCPVCNRWFGRKAWAKHVKGPLGPAEDTFAPVHVDAQVYRDLRFYPHATDPPLWWCTGRYDPVPVRYVGVGHSEAPRGWPVYRCLDCGDELFHARRSVKEEQKIRELAAAAMARSANVANVCFDHGDDWKKRP